ncbi:MAG: stage III sporulation protein AD [Firmicutes bacterium]|nr:stage III sporulation protein AD [Bacillota bacterium]
MEMVQVMGFSLVAVMLLAILREQRPEFAVGLSVVAGAAVFLLLLGRIGEVVGVIRDLASRAGISELYLSSVLRIAGVAYIAQFGAEVCRDAREAAIASKVELAGKVLILILAVPIIQGILETFVGMLS